MTGVWLNSFIMLMWFISFWCLMPLSEIFQLYHEKCCCATVIIKQQFISIHLLWQKITQLQDIELFLQPIHTPFSFVIKWLFLHTFCILAHLAKGHVSFCHHLASVRRRPSIVRRKLSHLNLLLWNPWTKLNQTWQGLSLGGSLSKLCQTDPPSIQDGCCY
jgi:hypothetical protein